jgi:hypothetical protein
MNKSVKVGAGNSILHHFQMEDAIEGDGWEQGIFRSAKLELVLRSTFAM